MGPFYHLVRKEKEKKKSAYGLTGLLRYIRVCRVKRKHSTQKHTSLTRFFSVCLYGGWMMSATSLDTDMWRQCGWLELLRVKLWHSRHWITVAVIMCIYIFNIYVYYIQIFNFSCCSFKLVHVQTLVCIYMEIQQRDAGKGKRKWKVLLPPNGNCELAVTTWLSFRSVQLAFQVVELFFLRHHENQLRRKFP